MNGEMMFEAVTGISDSFIEEADPDTNVVFRPWYRRVRPYMSLAAAFVLVLGLVAVYQHYGAKDAQIALDRADMKTTVYMADDDAEELYSVSETDSANGESGGEDPGSPGEEAAAQAEEAKSVMDQEKTKEEAREPEVPQSCEPDSASDDQSVSAWLTELPKGMPCVVRWNDLVYEPELVLLDTLPDEIVPVPEDADLEFEFDAAAYSGAELQVFADPENESTVYLACGEGYLCYHVS